MFVQARMVYLSVQNTFGINSANEAIVTPKQDRQIELINTQIYLSNEKILILDRYATDLKLHQQIYNMVLTMMSLSRILLYSLPLKYNLLTRMVW